MFLVISLATFPTQFPREIILPQTLASSHTWYSEGCVESKRKDIFRQGLNSCIGCRYDTLSSVNNSTKPGDNLSWLPKRFLFIRDKAKLNKSACTDKLEILA